MGGPGQRKLRSVVVLYVLYTRAHTRHALGSPDGSELMMSNRLDLASQTILLLLD